MRRPALVVLVALGLGKQLEPYVVAPLAHQRVDVGSVVPNAQLGIVASSDYPFIAMNRDYTNNHLGSLTSMGSSL